MSLKLWLQKRYQRSVLFELRQRTRDLFRARPLRSCRTYIQDVTTHTIQDDVVMEVYWVSEPVGPGPGASIYMHGDEVLRLDCFGSDLGHYHFNVRQSRFLPKGELTRIYFQPGTVQQHIDNGVFQLVKNLDYGRGMNVDPKVRLIELDPDAINVAAKFMRQEMMRINTERAETAFSAAAEVAV